MREDFAETGRIEHAPEIKQAIDDVMSNGDAFDVLRHPLGRFRSQRPKSRFNNNRHSN